MTHINHDIYFLVIAFISPLLLLENRKLGKDAEAQKPSESHRHKNLTKLTLRTTAQRSRQAYNPHYL